MTCPACGGVNLFRSHSRGFLEKGVRLLAPFRYYRCRDCDWRGLKSVLKWNTIGNYIASTLYLLFLGFLVIALIGTLLLLFMHVPT